MRGSSVVEFCTVNAAVVGSSPTPSAIFLAVVLNNVINSMSNFIHVPFDRIFGSPS